MNCLSLIELSVHGNVQKKFRYGTAGFRDKADVLRPVIARSSLVAALLSAWRGAVTGLMITASHNAVEDNGVKIIDNNGDMLPEEWEPFAEQLINCDVHQIQQIITQSHFNLSIESLQQSIVIIGWDSRPHSPPFSQISAAVINSIGSRARLAGMITTPLCHYLVGKQVGNHHQPENENENDIALTTTLYYSQLSSAFEFLISSNVNSTQSSLRQRIVCDASHGVGEVFLTNISPAIHSVDVIIVNRMNDGELNLNCGAEFVQKSNCAPNNSTADHNENDITCSFDGDADRFIAYHIFDNSFHLIDGDRILVLIAKFIQNQKRRESLPFDLHVVQTAYANGASSSYLRSILSQDCLHVTKTGIKHLIKKAREYDISVYFEANGHGSVYFSDKFINAIPSSSVLGAVQKIFNPYIGDAGSAMLAYTAILHIMGYSNMDVVCLYRDLISRQTKVNVNDLTVFECNSDETRLLRPVAIQERIDEIVCQQENVSCRCFVRPSGTEPIVRCYVEADCDAVVGRVTMQVVEAIRDILGSF